MAPHLTLVEQSRALQASAKGQTPMAVFDTLEKARQREGVAMVNLTVVRRFLKGSTHKPGKKEARGRKRIYSRRNVLPMNAARRKYIKGTKGTKRATPHTLYKIHRLNKATTHYAKLPHIIGAHSTLIARS